MKRDWEIIRRVLIALEEKEDLSPIDEESIPGFPPAEVAYNMGLMIEAGLADGRQMSTIGMGYAPPPTALLRLTFKGHDFLSSIRGEDLWNQVKKKAVEKGIDLSFDVAFALAKSTALAWLGIPPA